MEKKSKPVLKGYRVNEYFLEQGNESVLRGYIDHVCAKTEHEARKELLKMCYNYSVEENHLGDPITYINIRIKRFKEMDKYLVDGKLKTLQQIDYDTRVIENRNMLNKMLSDNPNSYAYIRKGGYFYCSNYCGYTEYKENAGVYTMEQAVKACLGIDIAAYMRPELIDVESHNKMISDKIEQLQSKILINSN